MEIVMLSNGKASYSLVQRDVNSFWYLLGGYPAAGF